MVPWYEHNRRLFREEAESIALSCPNLQLVVVEPGFRVNAVCKLEVRRAVVYGKYELDIPDTDRHIDYGVALILPDDYPKRPPSMYCNDPKLPLDNIDRHIVRNGWACLGIYADILMRWQPGSGVVGFIEDLVAPFLAWQVYYDAFGNPPPWGERSHSGKGILEFYAELLGLPLESNLVGFMKLLARKKQPQGHELCPCNSGKKLRDCHREMVYRARARVNRENVEFDLNNCENFTKIGAVNVISPHR